MKDAVFSPEMKASQATVLQDIFWSLLSRSCRIEFRPRRNLLPAQKVPRQLYPNLARKVQCLTLDERENVLQRWIVPSSFIRFRELQMHIFCVRTSFRKREPGLIVPVYAEALL